MTARSAAAQSRRETTAGFTLLEVMTALVVLALGLFAVVRLVPAGSRTIARAMEHSRASELSAARAELLLATPYSAADLDAGGHDDPSNPHTGNYYVHWNVEDDAPILGCKRVTVATRWPSLTGAVLARTVVVVPRTGGGS